MPLVMVKEDSAYRYKACGNTLSLNKGQLLPPCPRCSGEMEKYERADPDSQNRCCN